MMNSLLMLVLSMMVLSMVVLSSKFLKLFVQNLMFLLSFYVLLLGQYDYCWSSLNTIFMVGLDQYNYILIMFMFWLMGLVFLGLGDCSKFVTINVILLTLFVFLTFISMNLIYFYIFFECSLLPIFLIILIDGTGYLRVSSGMFMLIYTLIFSLPMLLCLISCFYSFCSLDIIYLVYNNMDIDSILYLMFIMAFLVKMPMYTLHIWLPKAHVEAPCYGSMILAGILLKLGSYGLLRFMFLVLGIAVKVNVIFMFFSLLGSLISSLACLRQSDMKILIAYSSVVHMGLMLGGMLTLSSLGYLGSMYMMIGHGLCSSGLFYIVNISYERLGSRLIYFNKGMINLMPSMTLSWFFLCSSNMAAPISLNLISEIYLMSSVIMFDFFMLILLGLISFFSACYSIMLFCVSQHGGVNGDICIDSGNFKEYLTVYMHWVPLNLLILSSGLFLCLSSILL